MTDDPLLVLHQLKKELSSFMRPQVLEKAADLLEALGEGGYLDRYEYFIKHSRFKEDCRYTQLSKELFLKEDAPTAKELVAWLYKNWVQG